METLGILAETYFPVTSASSKFDPLITSETHTLMFRLDLHHLRTLIALALLGLTLLPAVTSAQVPWTPAAPDFPRTAAEMNGFTSHTRHLEMWDYLQELRGTTTEMRLGSYGQTWEGRELPYAIFSRPLVSAGQLWFAPLMCTAVNGHSERACSFS